MMVGNSMRSGRLVLILASWELCMVLLLSIVVKHRLFTFDSQLQITVKVMCNITLEPLEFHGKEESVIERAVTGAQSFVCCVACGCC